MKRIELGKIIAPAKVRRAGNTDYPVLSMTMRDGLVNQADKFKKRIASADTSPYKVVERNQLVVGFPIDEGVLAFQNLYDEAIVSPAYNIWNVQDDASIDSQYLELFLRSPSALEFYKSKLRSTTARRRSLPNDIFLLLPVPVPPLAEQERIVKLLDEADELRKLRAQADRRTAELIPALFHKIFGDPATNPKRLPVKSLRELSEKFSDGPFGSNLKSSHYTESGVRVIRLTNIGVGYMIDDNKAYVSPEHFESLIKHKCLPGDVLVGTLGDPNLRAFILPPEIEMALNKTDCVQIRPKEGVAISEFICWLVNLPSTLAMASGMILGQTRSRISMGRLAELRVPVPPLAMQKEFAARVTEIRAVQAEQAASRLRLENLFQSLLHRAFNGAL